MTLDREYFDALYERSEDPWDLAGRWYEQRKYAVTVAALPKERYSSALEAGCSVGVLTTLLAERCDRLLAVDVAEAAVQMAAQRTAYLSHVTVEQRRLPQEWPSGTFDLVVLSELGYYFDSADLDDLLGSIAQSLEPGGALVAVHWRHPVADYPRGGDEVHAELSKRAAALGLSRTVAHQELDFLLDVYLRTPPAAQSVAQQSGLA